MAEVIGLTSGLVSLATFAFQSGITLYELIQSFQSYSSLVRDLSDELEALTGVLQPLTDTVRATPDLDLAALHLPLLQCGKACKAFEEEIGKCASRYSNRTSFRDWAKFKCMGKDMDGFRRLLAGYKMTINIALTDATLRKSSITAERLEGYQDLVKIATDDFEGQLQSIDEKLESILRHAMPASDEDATELQYLREERLGTQKCLQVCAQLSDHINQLQATTKRSGDPPEFVDPETLSDRVMNEGLQGCKDSLTLASTKLERHMLNIMDRLMMKSKTDMTSKEEIADFARLKEEWEVALQCREICSKADNQLNRNISIVENEGMGDAWQYVVSTNGKTIHGKNRGLGWRSRQVAGHLSDASLQALSRDMAHIGIRNTLHDSQPTHDNQPTHDSQPTHEAIPPVSGEAVEDGVISEFRDRYGPGFKLTPKSTLDSSLSSLDYAKNKPMASPKP